MDGKSSQLVLSHGAVRFSLFLKCILTDFYLGTPFQNDTYFELLRDRTIACGILLVMHILIKIVLLSLKEDKNNVPSEK